MLVALTNDDLMTSLAEGTDMQSVTIDHIYAHNNDICPFVDECIANITFRKCDVERFSLKFDLFDDSESDDDRFL